YARSNGFANSMSSRPAHNSERRHPCRPPRLRTGMSALHIPLNHSKIQQLIMVLQEYAGYTQISRRGRMEAIFINGVTTMPISTPATISLPLDIPQVDVLATKQTRDGKFIITVESRRKTTTCGICHKEISCNYGHGQAVRLRHLPILAQETY